MDILGLRERSFKSKQDFKKQTQYYAEGWKHWRAQDTRVEARGSYRNAEKWKDIWFSRLINLF